MSWKVVKVDLIETRALIHIVGCAGRGTQDAAGKLVRFTV